MHHEDARVLSASAGPVTRFPDPACRGLRDFGLRDFAYAQLTPRLCGPKGLKCCLQTPAPICGAPSAVPSFLPSSASAGEAGPPPAPPTATPPPPPTPPSRPRFPPSPPTLPRAKPT